MIDSVLRLIDRVIQWRNHRDRRRRDSFTDVFQPLYGELEQIHRNYGTIFEEARKRLTPAEIVEDFTSDAERMTETAALLKMRRSELEFLRVKVMSLAQQLSQIEWGEEEAAFIAAVIEYFASGLEPVPHIIGSTKLRQIMNALYEKGMQEENIVAGLDLVENAVFYQGERWAAVCESFAKLKTQVYATT